MNSGTALDLLKYYNSDEDSDLQDHGDQDLQQDSEDIENDQKRVRRCCSSESEDGELCLTKRKRAEIAAKKRKVASHPLININCLCPLNCPTEVSQDRRKQINDYYWSLSLENRRSFIVKFSTRNEVARRRGAKYVDGIKRKFTYSYSFEDDQGHCTRVCVAFFLNTLGYPAKSSNFIYRAYDFFDQRQTEAQKNGKIERVNPMVEIVKLDIMSYSPTISHYRREHAPNVLYLPSDLTCQKMYDTFNENRTSQSLTTCSYSFYNKQLGKMNIRFTKLGNELCEKCRSVEIHMKNADHKLKTGEDDMFLKEGYPEEERADHANSEEEDESSPADSEQECDVCLQWHNHKNAAINSRNEYTKDKAFFDGLAVSVDLQKVIQLPRLEGFKEAIFAKRIIAMNETFAPLGGRKNGPVYAILWNETVSGRKACDIASTFVMHVSKNVHYRNILYWLDNCASQNKNWDLMLIMILLVNTSTITVQNIIFKYLESGHTFMSADSFHAAVEKKIRPRELHTYDDFVDCVKQATDPEAEVIVMNHTDFFVPSIRFKPSIWNKSKCRPKLNEIKVVKFTKGSYEFQYKTEFSGDWKQCAIFTNAQLKEIKIPSFNFKSSLNFLEACRGIEESR